MCVCVCHTRIVFSHVQILVTLWTVACQAPLSMGFFRQEYWSGLTFPSPGDLPDPGIEPGSPALETDTLTSEPTKKGRSNDNYIINSFNNQIIWISIFSVSNLG